MVAKAKVIETKKVPEFKEKYKDAFISYLLLNAGGQEFMTTEILDKFPPGERIEYYYDPKRKGFVMSIPMPKRDRKKIIVPKKKIIT